MNAAAPQAIAAGIAGVVDHGDLLPALGEHTRAFLTAWTTTDD
jgi:hypothetical protein